MNFQADIRSKITTKSIAICMELQRDLHHFIAYSDAKERVICIKLQCITRHIVC